MSGPMTGRGSRTMEPARMRDSAELVRLQRVEAAARDLVEYLGIDDRYEGVVWPVDSDGNDDNPRANAAAKALAAAIRAEATDD